MGLPESQLKYYADFIEKELGIIYSGSNVYQLERRVNDICKNLDVSPPKLWESIQEKGPQGHVKQLLLDIATNNETSFFRDSKVYKAIENHIIPEWREKHPKSNLFRVWSAACSFGQEPYSLAILYEQLKKRKPSFPRIEIVATDISDIALQKAKSGKYSQLEVQRGLSAPMMIQYFKKDEENNWTINPSLKTSISFKKNNLLDMGGVSGSFDLVLCRNVLIYQKKESKQEILKRIKDMISPNGWLLLGAAENLFSLNKDFQQHIKDGAICYQKIS